MLHGDRMVSPGCRAIGQSGQWPRAADHPYPGAGLMQRALTISGLFLMSTLLAIPAPQEGRGEEPGRMPLLMPDDFRDLHLCGWRVEPGQPDPNNPLIEGETPWDRGGVGIHGS